MVVRAQGAGEVGGQPQGPGRSRWGRGGRRQGPSKGPSRFLTDSVAAGGDPIPGCAQLLVCPPQPPGGLPGSAEAGCRPRLPAAHAAMLLCARPAVVQGAWGTCLDVWTRPGWCSGLDVRRQMRTAPGLGGGQGGSGTCVRQGQPGGREASLSRTRLWHSACGFHGQPADSGWACLSVRHLSRRQARGLFGGGPDVVCLAAALRASECPLSRGLLSYPKSFPRVGSAPRFPCPRWPWRPGTRSPGGCSALFTDRGAVKCDN